MSNDTQNDSTEELKNQDQSSDGQDNMDMTYGDAFTDMDVVHMYDNAVQPLHIWDSVHHSFTSAHVAWKHNHDKGKPKKYVFTGETIESNSATLFQIKAIADFDNIKKGDIGGWVAREHNLSQDGNCWIGEGVKLHGEVKVYGDAQVMGNLSVHGNIHICHKAFINADGTIMSSGSIVDQTLICSDNPDKRINLNLFGSVDFNGRATIKANMTSFYMIVISGDVTVNCPISTDRLMVLIGEEIINIPPATQSFNWPVTITPKYINIGCEHHTAEEWWAFSDEEIKEMAPCALVFWSLNKANLKKMHQELITQVSH